MWFEVDARAAAEVEATALDTGLVVVIVEGEVVHMEPPSAGEAQTKRAEKYFLILHFNYYFKSLFYLATNCGHPLRLLGGHHQFEREHPHLRRESNHLVWDRSRTWNF